MQRRIAKVSSSCVMVRNGWRQFFGSSQQFGRIPVSPAAICQAIQRVAMRFRRERLPVSGHIHLAKDIETGTKTSALASTPKRSRDTTFWLQPGQHDQFTD